MLEVSFKQTLCRLGMKFNAKVHDTFASRGIIKAHDTRHRLGIKLDDLAVRTLKGDVHLLELKRAAHVADGLTIRDTTTCNRLTVGQRFGLAAGLAGMRSGLVLLCHSRSLGL